MKYSPIHKSLIISTEKLQIASDSILYAMKRYRELNDIPIGRRKNVTSLTDFDIAERQIIMGLRNLGIDLGVEWGHELDLSHLES